MNNHNNNDKNKDLACFLGVDVSQKIKNHCYNFFKLHQISLFCFYRIYDDGTCILLSSDNASLEYVFNNKIHLIPHIQDAPLKEKFWYIIPPNSIYQKLLFDFKEMFDCKIIFDFIECYENFYEVTYFGSYCEAEIASAYFMNFKEEFEKFSHYFKQEYKTLISYCEHKKIILPHEMLPNISRLKSDIPLSYPSSFHNLMHLNNGKLSPREMECVHHLSLGHTAKETAQSLNLSNRTVEFYLANIKNKLKCTRKSEIISLLSRLK